MEFNTFNEIHSFQLDFQKLSFLFNAVIPEESVDIHSLSPEGRDELLGFVQDDLGTYSIVRENPYREIMQIIQKERVFYVLSTLSREYGLGRPSRKDIDAISQDKRDRVGALFVLDKRTRRWDIKANSEDVQYLFGSERIGAEEQSI